MLTHSHWWDKADTPFMEYVVYICFKISFSYSACQLHLNSSKSYGRQTHKLMIPFVKLASENINSTLKQHDMDKFYDKFPHRNITLCTY